jgi:hypothetical protein
MKRKGGKAPKNVKKSEEDSSDGDSHVHSSEAVSNQGQKKRGHSASETPIRKEPKRSKQAQENDNLMKRMY